MEFSEIIERVAFLADERKQECQSQPEEAASDLEKWLPKPGKKELELEAFLKTLRAGEVYMLATVMYLGRGDFGTAGLLDYYAATSDTFHAPSRAIGQMVEKVPLGDYLRQGVEKLTQAGIDPNSLLTTHADTPLATLEDSTNTELKLGSWYCDTCGELISTIEEGVLLWLSRSEDDRVIGRDLRIVHRIPSSPRGGRKGCYPDEDQEMARDGSTISDQDLTRLTGPDGLVRLLSLIDDRGFSGADVNVIVMRLYVPGYEQARPYFQRALHTGVVEAWAPEGYFYQSQLRDIVANIARLKQ
jgi:hypothetical protein